MKICSQFLFITFVIMFQAPLAHAETRLEIANVFNIRAVNGAPYSSGFVSQNRNLKLRTGVNLIAFEYEEVFDSDEDDSFDIVKSNTFLLRVYLQNNASYMQRFIKPNNAKAAKKYALNPLFQIIRQNNHLPDNSGLAEQPIKFELTALASNQASFLISSTKLGNNSQLDIFHNKPKNRDENHQNVEVYKDPTNKSSVKRQPKTTASKMLDYWWAQATPEERAAFLQLHSQDK